MAVAQEFYDVFIRITDVDRVYPGGFKGYLTNFAPDIGYTIWFDEHLLREGAMSSQDIRQIVDRWRNLGLKPWKEECGNPVEWLELCVSSSVMGGTTLKCAWIAFDEETHGAFLKGTEPGHPVGPSRRGEEIDDELVPF